MLFIRGRFQTASRLLLLLIGLTTFLTVAAVAQQRPAPQSDDVLRINTDLIQTYVTVLDQKGRFVEGLNREQFQLLVDGQLRAISLFDRVTAGTDREKQIANGEAKPEEMKTSAGGTATVRGRTIVFFIDDLHLSLDSLGRTRQLLRHFLDTEMDPRDSVAIVSANGQIGFLQQFTDNKEVLQAAVARLNHKALDSRTYGMGTTPMSEYVALLIDNKSDSRQNKVMSVYVEECLKQMGRTSRDRRNADANRLSCEQLVKTNARIVLTQSAMTTANTYVALESLMRSSARAPGRKLAFFISDGFLMDTGRGPGLREKLDQIIDFAQRAGVVVYTIDAKGLSSNLLDASNNIVPDANGRMAGVAMSDEMATQDALNALARDTGGRALRNQNYFDRWVDKVLDETSNYYVLAWRPINEQETAKKFRSVKVSVVGNPQFTVRAPRGYLEGGNAKTELVSASADKTLDNKSRKADLQTALTDYYPYDSLPVTLSLTYLNTPANGMVLTSSMQIANDNFDFDGGPRTTSFQVAGVILNDKGKIANSFRNVVKVSPDRKNESSGIIYNHRATLSPGIYQVRVAANDENDKRLGSALQWIVIPDLAQHQLTLSSLLLTGEEMENARTSDGAAQVQLSVDHRFPRSSHLNWWVFVYNASRDANRKTDLIANTELMRGGRAIQVTAPHKLSDAGADPDRISFGGQVPLQSLPRGKYDLVVTVSDNGTRKTVSRRIDFEVQ